MASDGSLAALTAEVRQLRLTVEELIRNQAETQALSVRLSAHQSRIEQVTGQLDSELSRALQLEEAQWNDLVADMDQLTR